MMSSNSYFRAAAVAAAVLAPTASAVFNAASSTNVAMYWGQGAYQIPLTDVCNDPSIDIVNIGFVNGFPKNTSDYPSTNFANACDAEWFTRPDGIKSQLLSKCPSIGPGIKECQAKGKKVLLSIGGGWPTDYYLANDAVAKYFASFLWGAFGPQTQSWVDAGKPRPFGDAAFDGFDLDIESFMAQPPYPEYQYKYYDVFVTRLRALMAQAQDKAARYISAAPQCIIPDVRLSDAIKKSKFDWIFVQFYNTPSCSTRAGYNGLSNPSTSTFTFDKWASWLIQNSFDKSVKLYMGMTAGVDGAPNDEAAYLTPTEASKLISTYKTRNPGIFGGVMLWEATVSAKNMICNDGYATWIKKILNGKFVNEKCPASSSSSSVVSSTSLSSSSSSTPISTTSSSASSTPISSSSSYVYPSSTTVSSTSASSTPASSSSSAVSSSSSSSSSSITSSASSTVYSNSATSSSPVSSSSSTSEAYSSTSTSEAYSSTSTSEAYSSTSTSEVYSSTSTSEVYSSTSTSEVYSSTSTSEVYSSTSASSSSTSEIYPSSTLSSSSTESVVYPSYTSSFSVYSTSHYYYNTSTPCTSSTLSTESASSTGGPYYPSSSSTPCSSSASSTGGPYYPGSSSVSSTGGPYYPSSSSTPCSSSASSTGGPYYPSSSAVSSTGGPYYPSSSSTPCSSSASSTGGLYYPSSTGGSYPPVSTGGPYYPSSSGVPYPPVSTGGPYYPASSSGMDYPHTAITTVITTSYVDICPTGLTTIHTTITTTVYETAKPTAAYPEGWYTTVAVCHVCGPKPTTVTLTKPITVYPTGPAYTPVPSVEQYKPSVTPSPYTEGATTEVQTSTSTEYVYVTLTKVPVPAKSYTPAPYPAVNGTATYTVIPVPYPSGTGAASSSAAYLPSGTYSPVSFQGSASRFGAGVLSVVVVAVAAVVAL
ncbi:glycoside hydrolase superfamily [Clohesyomyces aquaticus]|uniref:chitinase n=1 Tax=Clohesyomyces aquaticus TaxID=1231657 RepID=A0A1Y1Z643_9PLEO|nr:glycoside hydrolase superfamily [Clohesyomyces aquaticus]